MTLCLLSNVLAQSRSWGCWYLARPRAIPQTGPAFRSPDQSQRRRVLLGHLQPASPHDALLSARGYCGGECLLKGRRRAKTARRLPACAPTHSSLIPLWQRGSRWVGVLPSPRGVLPAPRQFSLLPGRQTLFVSFALPLFFLFAFIAKHRQSKILTTRKKNFGQL